MSKDLKFDAFNKKQKLDKQFRANKLFNLFQIVLKIPLNTIKQLLIHFNILTRLVRKKPFQQCII